MIAVVDYGMGNVRSLMNALEYLGCECVLTADAGALADAERIILPGVGAFGDAMTAIRARGLDDILHRVAVVGGKPLLGICLGLQLLARTSDEHGHHQGLGWIDAEVVRFPALPGLKIPHMGWSAIQGRQHPLLDGIAAGAWFYFVHSFHMRCADPATVLATGEHGVTFTAAVVQGNLAAAQFHPEKSQDNGLRLLQNFLDWTP